MGSAVHAAGFYERSRAFRDLHFYQKWRAVWPRLARFPRHDIRLLDAGCGDGSWSREIALRRPGWTIIGIDRNREAIDAARTPRGGPPANTSFEVADFSGFTPATPFDIVLSICSTHYGPTLLDSQALFGHMSGWLAPSGHLLALVPRCASEAPFAKYLERPRWHQVFSRDSLTALCSASGLSSEVIVPCIGRVGTMAKQLDWVQSEMPGATGSVIGMVARGVAMVDAHVPQRPDRSLMWLLVARSQTGRSEEEEK